MTTVLREGLVAVLLLVGAGFALIGSIGLARLPDFYARLHGPTKATTLGVGAMLAASAVWFSGRGGGASLHELLVTGFLFLTAPASAHLLAKAALHLGVRERSRWEATWARPPAVDGAAHPGGPSTRRLDDQETP